MAAPAKLSVILLILTVLSQISNALNRGYLVYNPGKLLKGDYLQYGDYTFKFQTDCRLALYDTGKQIWTSSNRAFDQFCTCHFHVNGNLGIYHGGILTDPLWKALKVNKRNPGHFVLVLQKDRNVAIYGPVLWQTGTKAVRHRHALATNLVADSNNKGYVLYDGETLNAGESLRNGQFRLVMQEDCNLVLYDRETPLWSTKTADVNNNCICKLKSDGNLVVYKTSEVQPFWSALKGRSSADEGHYVLVLQVDGNLVIYDKPIWTTGTNVVKAMPAINGFS